MPGTFIIPQEPTTTGEAADGYQKEKIGDGKTLRYEVNLPSGAYTLVFEATAVEYGYVRTASMQMSVSTNFSKGFYILKSTEDGKTDLDLATKEGIERRPHDQYAGGSVGRDTVKHVGGLWTMLYR